MKIINNFVLKKKIISGDDNARILTANKRGGYYMLAENEKSRYDGLFFNFNGNMIKICEPFGIFQAEYINKLYCIEKRDGIKSERYFIPDQHNCLVYEKTTDDEIVLEMDIKESYDNSEYGRYYDINDEQGICCISFNKKENNQEKYRIFVAIKCDAPHDKAETWVKKTYEFDAKRQSPPFERYVFAALKTKARKIVIAASCHKENAIRMCTDVFCNSRSLQKKKQHRVEKAIAFKKTLPHEIRMAYFCAANSLEMLSIKEGIYAGLPWFFQFWARDELISVHAHMLQENFEYAKYILFKQLHAIHNHELIAHDGSLLNSADACLWLFFQLSRYINILKEKKILEKYLSEKDMQFIKNKLVHLIEGLEQNCMMNGLLNVDKKETWMDSLDTRTTAIELQALMLFSYHIAYQMTGNSLYYNKEQIMRENVLQKYWDGEILADSLDDPVVRPNIFIAAYVYPVLLAREAWIACFSKALSMLWNEWGGFSTIDKSDARFQPNHTGERPESYHNGDSWYYLNNLAAIVLHRIGAKQFKKTINSVINASKNEILCSGVIGCHSELSSSSERKSEGCLVQAWSAALFLELVYEVYGKDQT